MIRVSDDKKSTIVQFGCESAGVVCLPARTEGDPFAPVALLLIGLPAGVAPGTPVPITQIPADAPKVVLEFSHPASIDVVIGLLMKLRTEIVQAKAAFDQQLPN